MFFYKKGSSRKLKSANVGLCFYKKRSSRKLRGTNGCLYFL